MAKKTAQDTEPTTTRSLVSEHKKDLEIRTLKGEKQRLLRSLVAAEKKLQLTSKLERFETPIIHSRIDAASGRREATAVVCCSDLHIEEPVEPEKVNGLNEYSLDIAEHRIQRLGEGIIWLLEMHGEKFSIEDLVLWLGGDLFSGYIHEDLVESSQLSPVESVLWLQTHIVQLVDYILDNSSLTKIYIPCNYGNHGRTGAKKRIAMGAENSYEWLLYQQLAAWYADDDRVEFIVTKAQMVYMSVYDTILRFTHGDTISYGGGVGGVCTPLNRAIANWNVGQYADITIIGHFHTYMSLPHAVVNGSLIGYNPYSIAIRAPFEPPQQAFFLVDSKRGKCCATPIWVDER